MSTPRQSILSALAIYGPQTARQLAAAFGWKLGKAWHHIKAADRDCLIKRREKLPNGEIVFALLQIRGYRR